jgi:hypothetical protein
VSDGIYLHGGESEEDAAVDGVPPHGLVLSGR